MFWKKHKPADADLSWLVADMHSHRVPGVDDGAPDPAVSIELIRGLQQLGFRKFITTPHVLSDMYPNTPETILAGMERLADACSAEEFEADIQAAAEYFVDEQFFELLATGQPLLTFGDNHVLVEASMVTDNFDFREVIFELQLRDYTPVIAHPERYLYLKKDPTYLDNLRFTGCLFQLNLMALAGHYGALSQELAEYLIRKEYYDFAGTDIHHPKHLPLLEKAARSPQLRKLRDSGKLLNSTL